MKTDDKSLIILTWVEIILGGIGSLLFIACVVLASKINELSDGGSLAILLFRFLSALFFPLVLIFLSGLGLLSRKSWVKAVNGIILVTAAFFYLLVLFFLARASNIPFFEQYSIWLAAVPIFLSIMGLLALKQRPRGKTRE